MAICPGHDGRTARPGVGVNPIYFQVGETMTAKHLPFDLYFGYALSAVLFLFGVIVVLGLTIPEYVPEQTRITLGIVLLLWGLYRFVHTRMKRKEEKVGEE